MARGNTLGQVVNMTRLEARLDPNPALSINMTPIIEQLIRREQERLYEEFDWPFMRINRPITLQAGARYYDIPDDFHLERIERVDCFWGGKWKPMDRGIELEDYNIHDSDADVRQEPALKWDVSDTGDEPQIEIWPLPVTNDREVRVTGIRKLTPLIVAGDRLELDDMMVALFAASELLADRNKAQSGVLQQKAVSRFNTVKGRVIQKRKNSFSFSTPADSACRRIDRTPQVAYVRDAD